MSTGTFRKRLALRCVKAEAHGLVRGCTWMDVWFTNTLKETVLGHSVVLPPIKNRGRVVYCGSQFWGFSLWLLGPLAFGPVTRQYILGESTAEETALMVIRKQKDRSGQGPNIPFSGNTLTPSHPALTSLNCAPFLKALPPFNHTMIWETGL